MAQELFWGEEADQLLRPDLGVGFLEHEVEVVQFRFVEDKVDGITGRGQDDGANAGIGFWLMVFFFIRHYSKECLEVVGSEREDDGSKGYLQVMTIFAFDDIPVCSGVTICEMAHA